MIVWVSVWKKREMSVLRWVRRGCGSISGMSRPCQKRFFSCKLVEGNAKANETGLWVEEMMETQKDYTQRGREHNRKERLEIMSAQTPQGNEPFGCWESSKEEGWEQEGSKSDTLCWISAGGSGGSRLVRGEHEAQQNSDCIRHVQRSREEAVHIRLSQLDSTGGKEMWFKRLVVKLGFPCIILSDLTSSSQISFHSSGS